MLNIINLHKWLDQAVKPFVLEQCGYPINQAVNYRCRHTIHNHRAGDCEHFRAHAQDEALCLCQLRTQCFLSKRLNFFRQYANNRNLQQTTDVV